MKRDAPQYSVISLDVLNAIDSDENLKLIDKQRMFAVYVLLAMTCEKMCVNDEWLIVTKWGAMACSKRLGMGQETAKYVIQELQKTTVANGENALQVVGKLGIYNLYKPCRSNGMFIPNILRTDSKDKPSAITRIFAGKEKYRVKFHRLAMLMRVYQLFENNLLCAPKLMSKRVLPSEEFSYPDDSIQVGFVPTQIFDVMPVGAWCFSPSMEKRDLETKVAIEWLAEKGLISMIRLAVNKGAIYTASFQSKYWRELLGDFQTEIRDSIPDEDNAWSKKDAYETTMPVFFVGDYLVVSIMPQYLVISDALKKVFKIQKEIKADALNGV